MMICAIDPGVSGAVAFVSLVDVSSCVYDLPTVHGRVDAGGFFALMQAERQNETHGQPVQHCFIEQAQAMPQQGVTSTFHYGVSYGILLGILAALALPYTEVRPGRWKRAMGLSHDKEQARLRAMQLFPHVDLHLRKHHGRAEALLLGWWGRQWEKGTR